MKLGKVSFNLESSFCQEITKDDFYALFKGVDSSVRLSYWKEFSKEIAKYRPKKTRKKVKKEEVIEEPKEDVKEG